MIKFGLICSFALLAMTGCAEIAAQRNTKLAEAAFPPVGQFIQVDGKRVHYITKGSGPALIMLHGAGGNIRDWTFAAIDEVAKTHTVYAFDRPGHGYTDTLHKRGESPAEQAAFLHKAATALDIKHATIMGYSFGGAVALAWGVNKPEFVDGLMLISSVANEWPGGVDTNYNILATPFVGHVFGNIIGGIVPKSRIYRGYRDVFAPQSPPDGFLEHVGPELSVRPKFYRASAKQIARAKPHIIAQEALYVERLTMPIEIVHGTADQTVPIHIHARVLASMLPNANLTEIEGMGHGAHQLALPQIYAAIKRLSAR